MMYLAFQSLLVIGSFAGGSYLLFDPGITVSFVPRA